MLSAITKSCLVDESVPTCRLSVVPRYGDSSFFIVSRSVFSYKRKEIWKICAMLSPVKVIGK